MDTATLWIAAGSITLFAGFVKGATGFALPMLMISGLTSLMAPDIALAYLILPTLVANLWQALRGGTAAIRNSLAVHWRFVVIVMLCILAGGQLIKLLSPNEMTLALGVPVLIFALAQLAGLRLRLAARGPRRRIAEVAFAVAAGGIGGISGVWGPPTVIYLTALDTPKREQMQITGLVFGLGAVMLLLTHLRSGILNAATAPVSALLIVPALAGMALGFAVHDRLDQRRFRQITLVLLIVAGLNLIRRGLMG